MFSKAQASVEALFAVILLLGLLSVVSLIALQQRQQTDALQEQESQRTLCRNWVNALETVSFLQGKTRFSLESNKPVWLTEKNIFFSNPLPKAQGIYCSFNATVRVQNLATNELIVPTNALPVALPTGAFTIEKSAAEHVIVRPPLTGEEGS